MPNTRPGDRVPNTCPGDRVPNTGPGDWGWGHAVVEWWCFCVGGMLSDSKWSYYGTRFAQIHMSMCPFWWDGSESAIKILGGGL